MVTAIELVEKLELGASATSAIHVVKILKDHLLMGKRELPKKSEELQGRQVSVLELLMHHETLGCYGHHLYWRPLFLRNLRVLRAVSNASSDDHRSELQVLQVYSLGAYTMDAPCFLVQGNFPFRSLYNQQIIKLGFDLIEVLKVLFLVRLYFFMIRF